VKKKRPAPSCEFRFPCNYLPTVTHAAQTGFVRRTLAQVVGEKYVMPLESTIGAEDLSHYLQAKPGCYFTAQGMDHSNAVMSNVFTKDLNELAKMNAVYGEFFKTNPPSRATVEVTRLPRDVKIEIAVVASK
jgi:metal-dependent amidase/aminoacylase/carboxypeptidase family protein